MRRCSSWRGRRGASECRRSAADIGVSVLHSSGKADLAVVWQPRCANADQVRAQAKAVRIPAKRSVKRRATGETLAEIAKSYAVDASMISRLAPGLRAPFVEAGA